MTPYERADDLGVVIATFSPVVSVARRERLARTLAPLRAGGAVVRIAELLLPGRTTELADDADMVRVPTEHVMWHKERLLMAAVRALPATCTKVAWLDGDVLFTEPGWMPAASAALERAVVLQPFSRVRQSDETTERESYAAVLTRDAPARLAGVFERHGHTGYAWCARRSLVDAHGLYGACIAGGADHAMAHAFTGDTTGACLDRVLGRGKLRADFARWAEGVLASTEGHVGVLDGELVHQAHGTLADRRYVERYAALQSSGFDPARHLIDDGQVYRFSAAVDPRLPRYLQDYFVGRRGD